jgi:hypothetical protein
MLLKIIALCILLSMPFMATSQTLSAQLLDFNEQPVEGVKVFYDQSTISTFTDINGVFEIPVSQRIPNPKLVFYHPDFEIYMVSKTTKIKPKYYLKPKEKTEISNASSSLFSTEEMLVVFREMFLGSSINANQTRIGNKDVLQFRFDTINYKLYASATEPLQIRNEALGYTIEYYLDEFEIEFSANSLQQEYINYSFFYGYSLFKDIDSTKVKEREIAFNGTMKHFFKQIITGNFNNIKSKIFLEKRKIRLKKLFDVQQLNPNLYKLNLNRNYVDYKDDGDFTFYIQPHYKKQASRIYHYNLARQPYHENLSSSVKLFRPYILVDNYGNALDQEYFEISGDIFDINIADRLPLDYNFYD